LELRRAFGGRVAGLALQGLLKHSFGEHFPDGDNEVFHVREFGAPGRPAGTPDAVHQMFGDTVQIGTDFIDGSGGLFGERHPWHLIGVGAIQECGFRAGVYQIEQLNCKPWTAPSV
jgi:hypothetical protein